MSEPTPPASADRLTEGHLLARNVGLNVAGYVAPVVLALVSIPVLIRGLGDARFGVLSLAWTLVGYFTLFDLGMGRALTQLVSEALGRDAPREVASLVWTALWMLVPLGVVGGVAVGLSAPWMVHRVLRIPSELQGESVRAFVIFACAIPFTVHTAGLRGVLEATQSFGRVNALRLPLAFITFLGPLVVLPFTRSVAAATAVLAAGRAVLWYAHLRVSRQVFAPLRSVSRPARAHVRPLLTIGGWMTVSNIISPLMYAGDRFVVGALLSMQAVTYYTTAYESVTRLWLVTGVLLPVLFPALTLALTRDTGRASALFDRAMRLTIGVAFPAALAVGGLAPEWLTVWIGPDIAAPVAPLAHVMAAGVFANIVAQIVYTLVQAAGRADLTGKFHLVEVVPYGLLLWASIERYGAMGVVVAWSVRVVVDAALLFAAARRVVPSVGPTLRRGALLAAIAVPLLVAPLAMPSRAARVAYVLVTFVASCAYGWLRLLRDDERAYAWRALRDRVPVLTAASPPRPPSR